MSEEIATRTPDATNQFVIETVEGLKALSDPLRMRILMSAAEASFTVKELAAKLRVPQTRLYYHVAMLEKNGLLRVASRRLVSGIEERRYEATADNWTIAPSLFTDIATSGVLRSIFDVVRAELEHVFESGPGEDIGTAGSVIPILTVTQLELSEEQMTDFVDKMTELVSRYAVVGWGDAPAEGNRIYNAMFVTYQHPGTIDAP
jgi:DNA-binding transcriptional ArsR family regulator